MGRTAGLVDIALPALDAPATPKTFRFTLCRDKLRKVPRHEGQYLLLSNFCAEDPAVLQKYYMLWVEIEEAFSLSVRLVDHQKDKRIGAHLFVAFVAYAIQVTLKQRLKALAPGLAVRRAWLRKVVRPTEDRIWTTGMRGRQRPPESLSGKACNRGEVQIARELRDKEESPGPSGSRDRTISQLDRGPGFVKILLVCGAA